MTVLHKKLIEVALPLEAINKASAHEKMPGIGPHPRGLHLWWARRPQAAARAVIFAQMVDDPSSHPETFPTPDAQDKRRQELFRLIEQLVLWENTSNEDVLNQARDEIWKSWRVTCAENKDDPRAKELYNPDKLPAFHDPFAGGGALPLEAQRLGLEAYASDLNPVAVLINKAMIEIPPKFAGRPPVNPEARRGMFTAGGREENEDSTAEGAEPRRGGAMFGPPRTSASSAVRSYPASASPRPSAFSAVHSSPGPSLYRGAQGLAEDVRYYGQWMRDEAEKSVGHLYPKIEITAEMARERPDLKPLVGRKLTVIAWLWARTVKSPNPAFAQVDVPLVSTFMLSTKPGKEAYVEPVLESGGYRFSVKVGKPKDAEAAQNGTKLARGANFQCLMSGTPMAGDYIKAEGTAGRMGAKLMAIVADGERGRVYLAPTLDHEAVARHARPLWKPELPLSEDRRAFWTPAYGMTRFGDLFTARQLVALTTFSDLVQEARQRVMRDALVSGLPDDGKPLDAGGIGAIAYSDAVAMYLAFAVDRCADFSNSCTRWVPGNQKVMNLFGKQAIAMAWDYPEAGILDKTVGGFVPAVDFVSECILKLGKGGWGRSVQADAATNSVSNDKVVSTDPPYYDNIGYADLSDFFYIWLRRSLQPVFPDLFATLAVPKAEELVATPYRHGSKEKAEAFFLEGMTRAMGRLAEQVHPAFPVTIYYAFKQSETESETGTSSTGWETFLDAVIRAGFSVTGTWPMRSEQTYRMIGMGTNALASSIILVCRKRAANAPTATRRQFHSALQAELPQALINMQRGNIAPVDLAQAAIGPGMAIYTRYARVLDAAGQPVSVGEALSLINQTLDEALAQQEGDFDADSRWAVAWFEQYGYASGEYGVAETLSRAKDTSMAGMAEDGILLSQHGKVRLLKPSELSEDWDPSADKRLTVWETVHQLIRALESGGEGAAAVLAGKLGSKADVGRELAYRLYVLCERKKRTSEALSYNGLVQSWPEIMRLAREGGKERQSQVSMF
jgi:putative DNA methylase